MFWNMRNAKIASVILLLIVSFSSHPGLCYRVDDFRINDSIPPSSINNIVLSTDGKGKFAVNWLDSSSPLNSVYTRVYRVDGTPIGPQVKIPDISDQGQLVENISVENAMLPNGNVVVVRSVRKDSTDSQGAPYKFERGYVDILDSLGNQLVTSFRADTFTASMSRWVNYDDVAADSLGNFKVLISVQAFNNGAYSWPFYFQQFYLNGQQRGGIVKVNDCTTAICKVTNQNHTISIAPNGRFIIAWDAALVPGLRLYDSTGVPMTEVLIPSCDDSLPYSCSGAQATCMIGTSPRIGIHSSGSFMVAFNACDGSPYYGNHPYVRSFDSLRVPLTPHIKIDDLDTSYSISSRPKASVLNDSEYVAAWADRGTQPQLPDGDVFLKRYKRNGEQIGIKYRINNSVGENSSHEHLRIAVSNEHVFVVWRDRRHNPDLINSVYGQIMPVDEIGFFTPGDLNYDDNITLADVIGTVNYLFKGVEFTPEGSALVCDVNGDCKVTLADAIYLVNFVLKPGWPDPVGCSM